MASVEKEISIRCPLGAKIEVRDGYVLVTHPERRTRKIPMMELLQQAIALGEDLDLFQLGTEQQLDS